MRAGTPPLKKNAELFFPPEFADDFPVAMQISDKYGLVYVITKLGAILLLITCQVLPSVLNADACCKQHSVMTDCERCLSMAPNAEDDLPMPCMHWSAGLLFVYDLETATAVYRNRISPDPIFLTANSPSTGGFYAINRCLLLPTKLLHSQGVIMHDCIGEDSSPRWCINALHTHTSPQIGRRHSQLLWSPCWRESDGQLDTLLCHLTTPLAAPAGGARCCWRRSTRRPWCHLSASSWATWSWR